jgi:hypothetical protein
MLEIVIFLEVLRKQPRFHILMKPIFERFIQIDRKKTSCVFLCSDARADMEECFLLNWKTYRGLDVVAVADCYSHCTVVG